MFPLAIGASVTCRKTSRCFPICPCGKTCFTVIGPMTTRKFKFDQIVELLEIGPPVPRGVMQLSGGEKQRKVALACALLRSPRLLLLDEPLVSLDARLKAKILPYLRRIRDTLAVPMLYVTHDRDETLSLGDEMVVLVQGKVAQTGTVREVFNRPANLSVAGIVAVETILAGRIVETAAGLVTVSVGDAMLSASEPAVPPGTSDVHVCIRAEDVALLANTGVQGSPRNRLPGIVKTVARDGAMMRVDLDLRFSTGRPADGSGLRRNGLATRRARDGGHQGAARAFDSALNFPSLLGIGLFQHREYPVKRARKLGICKVNGKPGIRHWDA